MPVTRRPEGCEHGDSMAAWYCLAVSGGILLGKAVWVILHFNQWQ